MSENQKRIEKAEKWLQRGKLEAALEEFLAVLDSEPTHDMASHTAADIYVSLGRNAEGSSLLATLFERQCEHGEKNKAAVTYRKLTRIGRPSGDQSLKYAQELAKNPSDSLKGYQSAYQAFTAKGRNEQALSALNGIVEIEPTVENLRKVGDLAAELQKNDIAAHAYLRAGQTESDQDRTFLFFEQAHRLQPDKPEIATAYAGAVLTRGDGEKAARALQPHIAEGNADPTARHVYARALMRCNQPAEAIPLLWEACEREGTAIDEVMQAVEALIGDHRTAAAVTWLEKIQQREFKAGRRREFLAAIKQLNDRHSEDLEFLEFSAELFNLANRESDYGEALQKLFDLYFASGNFALAAERLERAAEVDPYEPGHRSRLELLRGKVGNQAFAAIAERLSNGMKSTMPAPENVGEGTVLQDLLAQAQIYLRYSMDEKAREKLRRVQELFPSVEESSRDVRELFAAAAMLPPGVSRPAPTASDDVPPHTTSPAAPTSRDEAARLGTITRSLYRQSSVKSVLLTAVNELGRFCNARRCFAVLCSPGKPPSIALEYCAPGLSQSDIHGVVKLVSLLQPLVVAHGALDISARKTKPVLRPMRKPLASMGIESILAVPLLEAEDHAGLLVLADDSGSREWSASDSTALATGAEQIMLALNNVRLRRLVKDLAVTESGSGLVKRSSYLDVLVAEVTRSMDQGLPLSVMLMSFSGGDESGSKYGDKSLEKFMRHVAQLVCSHVRQHDVAFRYGPASIAVVLGDTPDKSATLAAEKLRKVASVVMFPGRDAPAKISIGVAQAMAEQSFDPCDVVTELINRAERALQASISLGGDNTQLLASPELARPASA